MPPRAAFVAVATIEAVPTLVERAARHRREPARARPRHRGQRPGAAPRDPAAGRAGHPDLADRRRGTQPGARDACVQPARASATCCGRCPTRRGSACSAGLLLVAFVAARRPSRVAGTACRPMLTFEKRLVPLRRLRQDRPPRHRPDARRRRDRRASSGRTRRASRRCASSRPGSRRARSAAG